MKIVEFKDSISLIKNDLVEAGRFYSSKNTAGVQVNLQPGGEVEKHTTPEDVFFYILRGRAIVTINNETEELKEGASVSCPAGIPKAIKNMSDSLVKVMVVKMNPDTNIPLDGQSSED